VCPSSQWGHTMHMLCHSCLHGGGHLQKGGLSLPAGGHSSLAAQTQQDQDQHDLGSIPWVQPTHSIQSYRNTMISSYLYYLIISCYTLSLSMIPPLFGRIHGDLWYPKKSTISWFEKIKITKNKCLKIRLLKVYFCKISFPILSLSHHLPNNPQLSVTAKI